MTATPAAIPHVPPQATGADRAELRPDSPSAAPTSLNGLLALDVPVLAALYASARVPRVEDVRGDLRGRMLATTVLHGAVAGAVRSFASSDVFPWKGKTFSPAGASAAGARRGPHQEDASRGDGINRVILDRWRLYRFETFIGPSRAGNFDALQLDYDNRDNPFFIRPIKDEMRELSSGLWLGQAYLELRGKANLVLYFGLAR